MIVSYESFQWFTTARAVLGGIKQISAQWGIQNHGFRLLGGGATAK